MPFSKVDAARMTLVMNQLQTSLGWRDRQALADTIARTTAQMIPSVPPPDDPVVRRHAEALRQDGISRLGPVLSAGQVAEIHAYLKAKPCYTGHVPAQGDGQPRTVEECATLSNLASYQLPDVLGAPHLLELANRPDILSIVESYLGCVPTLYSVNFFWSFPGKAERFLSTQNYHRDFDDFRFCTLFLFLTDLTDEDGAHYYIRGTHRTDVVEQIYSEHYPNGAPFPLDKLFERVSYHDQDIQPIFGRHIETVKGLAGSAVFEDTYGLHMGAMPRTNRLVGWMRYGLYQNATTYTDRLAPPAPRAVGAGRIPDTVRHKFINRLLVEP
jgi:hypothetical protein